MKKKPKEKAFKLTVLEETGEREHSSEYLVYAPDLETAVRAGRKIVRDWFPDIEDDDVEVQDDGDICHFFDGTIVVSINGICPTTKREFIQEYLNRRVEVFADAEG